MLQNFYVVKTEDTIAANAFIPNCANNNGKIEAAKLHSITDLVFELFIDYQYGAADPVETSIPKQDIIDAITTALPGGTLPDYLEFSWDTTTHAITVTPRTGAATAGANDVDYSVCMFEGIILMDPGLEAFNFYKAKNRLGKDTIVFKTILGADVLHYYDISNDLP